MPTPLHINITDPCHEDWQQMTPNEQGRHCLACQKTVVDFTLTSDQEILHYMATASSQVCGRFSNDQLDKVYREQKRPPIKRWRYIWNLVVATFLVTGNAATAQSKKAPVKKVKVIGHKLKKEITFKLDLKAFDSEVKLDAGIDWITSGFTVITEKPTFYEKIIRNVEFWLPDKEITIEPGPVIPGSSFSVNLQLKQMGTYRIELTDPLGKRVYVQLFQVEQEQQTVLMATEPAWRRGVYWLRVTHTTFNKEYQTKILLQ